jgi:hypothetical protein
MTDDKQSELLKLANRHAREVDLFDQEAVEQSVFEATELRSRHEPTEGAPIRLIKTVGQHIVRKSEPEEP